MNELRKILSRFRLTMLRVRIVEAAMWGGIVGGLVAAVLLTLQAMDWWAGTISPWRIPVVLLPAGAFGGAVVALVRGVSVSQAARWLDGRYELKDRLGTAAELLAAADDSSEAKFVYAQAHQAARSLPRGLDCWRCTRRMPAGLLLTILLCGALLLLPSPDARLAEILLTADAGRKQAIQANLRLAAGRADPETKTKNLLSKLSHMIEVRDETEIRKILEKLRRSGLDVQVILAESLPLHLTAGEERSPAPARENLQISRSSDAENAHREGIAQGHSGESVTTIYNPNYTEVRPRRADKAFGTNLLKKTKKTKKTKKSTKSSESPAQIAWRAACRQAAQAGAPETVPLRYRSILRAFTRR